MKKYFNVFITIIVIAICGFVFAGIFYNVLDSDANVLIRSGCGILFVAWLLDVIIAAIMIYFLPSGVAEDNKHPYCTAITIINLFFGWTLIGWVGALVWATILPNNKEKDSTSKGNKYEQLKVLQELKESGAITNEEFDLEKKKLLK